MSYVHYAVKVLQSLTKTNNMIYLLLFKFDQPFELHRSFDTFLQSPFAKFSKVAFLRGLMYLEFRYLKESYLE